MVNITESLYTLYWDYIMLLQMLVSLIETILAIIPLAESIDVNVLHIINHIF
jgi:hypothetical protein